MDILVSAMQFITNQCSWSSARACSAAIFAGLFSLYSTVISFAHPSIPGLVALVLIDFALAAGIALYENHFSWAGFRHGLGKFVAYSLIFIVTGIADNSVGIAGWPLNITVGISCWAIAGELGSCLRHIEHIFPGLLPPWVLVRITTFQRSVEYYNAHCRRKADWRSLMETENPIELSECRGRIPDDEE